MEITFDRKNVGVCLQQRFTVPTYQRDYKWETKHLQELLTDIQEEFLASYQPNHGRQEVGSYSPYFLGTIITTDDTEGRRSIIDGQQRVTTLTLILSYFFRIAALRPELGISSIEPMLRRQVFGQASFNIDFDDDRRALFALLLDNPGGDLELLQEKVDTIPNLTHGSRELFRLFGIIENFLLDEVRIGLIPYFVDYLTERVYLFEIGVPSEQDGHKVFVTMNDRGLKLSPIDLLKGHILSNIRDDAANKRAHESWAELSRKLKRISPEEDATFFKTWLRAQYAVTTRGKSRGDQPGDYEQIGDAYHRWVVANGTKIGLVTSDDFFNFVTSEFAIFAGHYEAIKAAEATFSGQYAEVFYNGSKDLTLQSMAILASVGKNDSNTDVSKKIKLVSRFLDYYASARIMNGKDNTYDNIKDYVFAISRKIRNKPVGELADILVAEANGMEEKITSFYSLNYVSMKRQDLLHILARVAEHLENGIEQTTSVGFPGYIDRNRATRTFDVEHVIPADVVAVEADLGAANDFGSQREIAKDRDSIGALILLPRGRNRSLKAMLFKDKKTRYATENVLAQTLCESLYDNNPQLDAYIAATSLPLAPVAVFNKAAVNARLDMYQKVASTIWNPDKLKALV